MAATSSFSPRAPAPKQLWTMLADGSNAHQITTSGRNTSPTGGWK